jgi:cell division septation protein DedD
VRRYRPSRSWPVGGLALIAAAGAVLATGTLSSTLGGGPDPAFAARIGQSVAGARSGMEARAASPAAAGLAASPPAPPPAGAWQIQVGAFRNLAAAEAHRRSLEREVPELARLPQTHQLRGRINRVRIGGIEDEAAARGLCGRIRAVGHGCFVAEPES